MKIIRGTVLFCITLPLVGTFAVAAQQPELVVQLGHSGGINAAAFSPDGRLVVSGGDDPIAIVWEAGDRQSDPSPRRAQEPCDGAVAFSPDGKLILTGSGSSDESGETNDKPDNTARLWMRQPVKSCAVSSGTLGESASLNSR